MEELRVNPAPYQKKGFKDIIKLLETKFPYNVKPINSKIRSVMKKVQVEEQNRQIVAQDDQVIHFFSSYRGCRHGSMKTHMFRSSGCSAAEILKFLQNSGRI